MTSNAMALVRGRDDDADKLGAMIERLRSAPRGDRRLSDDVLVLLGWSRRGLDMVDPSGSVYCVRTAPALTTSIDSALSLGRTAPEKVDILRDAMSAMSKKFCWHMAWPTDEQMALLPIYIVIEALRARGGE